MLGCIHRNMRSRSLEPSLAIAIASAITSAVASAIVSLHPTATVVVTASTHQCTLKACVRHFAVPFVHRHCPIPVLVAVEFSIANCGSGERIIREQQEKRYPSSSNEV